MMYGKRKWTLLLSVVLLLGLAPVSHAAAGPQVRCTGATQIGKHSAQLNGYVSGGGALQYTQKGLYLSAGRESVTKNRYTSGLSARGYAFSFNFKASEVESLCGTLRAGTIYYYKLFVIANGKEYVSDIAWFRTADEKTDPKTVVSTYEPVEITMNDALLSARVTKNDYQFKFTRISLLLGTSASSLTEAVGIQPRNATMPEASFRPGQYVSLNPLTTYYYQFCVVTTSGASYVSAVRSFTTAPPYVQVYLDAGTGVAPSVMQAAAGAYYTLPLPVREGYVFAGWYAQPTDSMPVAQTGIWPYTCDMVLYGRWTPSGSAAPAEDGKQQLLFDVNHDGLGIAESKAVKLGKKYGTLPEPSRAGYKFKGWYTSASGGVKVSSSTRAEAAGQLTLYAAWSPRSYKVTFNANGGSVSPQSSTLKYGETYMLPTPVRDGYVFLGWYTDKSGGTLAPQTWVMNTASKLTLYAQWSPYGMGLPAGVPGGLVG